MSTTELSTKITALVYLDKEEAQEIPLTATWIKAPTEISKALVRYVYEGFGRGWVMSGGTLWFHRIKKDGTPYKEEQDVGIWRDSLPEGFEDKHRPISIPTVTWS